MDIRYRSLCAAIRDGHRWTAGALALSSMADYSCMSALAIVGFNDSGDDVALDELSLLLGGLAKRGGGETVDVPHGAEGGLMKQADGVGGKQLALAASATQAEAEIFGGVLGHEWLDLEAVMDARVQRAIAPQGEPV